MRKVVKEFTFDACHRLLDYPGKCAHLHGHTYKVRLTFEGEVLDDMGILFDFGEFKEIKQWVEDNWDHGTLLNSRDAELLEFTEATPEFTHRRYLFVDVNPTAEVMAEELYQVCQKIIQSRQGEVTEVQIWETPTSSAVYTSEVDHE